MNASFMCRIETLQWDCYLEIHKDCSQNQFANLTTTSCEITVIVKSHIRCGFVANPHPVHHNDVILVLPVCASDVHITGKANEVTIIV